MCLNVTDLRLIKIKEEGLMLSGPKSETVRRALI